ncbi:MAG TPA: AsmA-like C-terminal region-containing protein [Cyclobacteriaceae bacterium]|nr:AsmA-like C-terminal region-containing protein [Cyclobacteriaceae bacterium]
MIVRSRLLRIAKISTLALAGTSVFLVLVIWCYLLINRDSLRTKLEKTIDRQINTDVYFDDIAVTLFRDFPNITVTLQHVSMVGRGEFAGDTLVKADELDFEIRLASLISGKETELKSIHLQAPTLMLLVLPNGHANYDLFTSDASNTVDTSETGIALDEVRVSKGNLHYTDAGRKLDVWLNDLTFSGRGDFARDVFDLKMQIISNEFTLNYGKLRYFYKKELEVDATLEMDFNARRYAFKQNDWRINHFRFNIEGSLAQLEKGYDFGLTFATQSTEFKNILSLVPGVFMRDFKQISTQGELGFTGFINGAWIPDQQQLPSMMANCKVTDARFKIDTLPDPIDHIQMEFQISNLYGVRDSTVFDFKNLSFEMLKHKVQGRFLWKGIDHIYMDGDIHADLDLAELERMYPVTGMELGGDLLGEIKVKGPLAWRDSILTQVPVFQLQTRFRDGRIKYDHLPAAVDSIQFVMTANNPTGKPKHTVFDFERLFMKLDKNTVGGFLRIKGYEELQIKSDLKANIDLADLETIFPLDNVVAKGKLSFELLANGVYQAATRKFPAVKANVELQDGYLKTEGYPEPLTNIRFKGGVMNDDGRFADTRLTIDQLTYTLEDEPFEVKGSVANLEHLDYDLQVKGKVDLAKLSRVYPVSGFQWEGIVQTNLETSGRLSDVEAGRYENVSSTGTLSLNGIEVKGKSIPQPCRIDEAVFSFTPKRVQLDRFRGRFGKSKVTMTGDITNYMAFATRKSDLVTADLMLRCDTLDINQWMSLSDTTQQSQRIKVWQVPMNLKAIFDSEIDYVHFDDMHITKLDGSVEIEDGILRFKETGFNTLNAAFNVSGDYNTRDINHPTFDLSLDIKELDINRAYREMRLVRELLPAAGNADGMFSITYKLKGELNDSLYPRYETLVGGGEMRIANTKINGMKIFEELSKATKRQEVNDPHLRDFVLKSEVRDDRIIIKPFSIKVSGFDADIEGTSEMSGAIQYLVKLQLLPFGIKIPFHVTGNYDNPKVTIGKGHVLPPRDSTKSK